MTVGYDARFSGSHFGVWVVTDADRADDAMTVLKKRVNEVIQEYKAKANEAIGEADKLDREKKYAEAINAFDAVCKNFPFLDILQHANRRKGEILRKVTFGG